MLFQRYYANTFISVISNSYISFCVLGYHTRINADVGRAHMSFYIVLPALRREAKLVELTYRLVPSGPEAEAEKDGRKAETTSVGRNTSEALGLHP